MSRFQTQKLKSIFSVFSHNLIYFCHENNIGYNVVLNYILCWFSFILQLFCAVNNGTLWSGLIYYKRENIAESSSQKILRFFGLFGDIGTFGDMLPEIKIIVQKWKKLGVWNDVLCRSMFKFYLVVYNRLEWRELPKYVNWELDKTQSNKSFKTEIQS
jgi:hypothetical protein